MKFSLLFFFQAEESSTTLDVCVIHFLCTDLFTHTRSSGSSSRTTKRNTVRFLHARKR